MIRRNVTIPVVLLVAALALSGCDSRPASSAEESPVVTDAPVEQAAPQGPLKVSWSVVTVAEGAYTAFVVAENPTNKFIDDLEIDITSSGGELGRSGFRPLVIPPGGKSVYAVGTSGPNDEITASVVGEPVSGRYVADLEVDDGGWDSAYSADTLGLSASIRNTSTSKIMNPQAALIVYDADGRIAAVGMSDQYIPEMEPGTTQQITFTLGLPVGFAYGSHEYVSYGESE